MQYKKIILWLGIGLVMILVLVMVIPTLQASSALNAKREATRVSQQTAYVIERAQQTQLALTPTLASIQSLKEACTASPGQPVEIKGTLQPGMIVKAYGAQFDPGSFFILQDDLSARLDEVYVCSEQVKKNCIVKFTGGFRNEDLRAVAQNGDIIFYGEVVILTGTVQRTQEEQGERDCTINLESLRLAEGR